MGSESVAPVAVVLASTGCADVPCQLLPSPDWERRDLLAEKRINFNGTWHGFDQPTLLVCHLLTGGPSFILVPESGRRLPEWYLTRHAACLADNKAGVVLLPGVYSYLLVPLQGSAADSTAPIFLGYRVSLPAADFAVATLKSQRLPLIFDLDETLLYARSLSQLKDDVRAFERRRAEGAVAEGTLEAKMAELEDRYRRQDLALLQQFAANELVDWQGNRVAASYEPGMGEDGIEVARPVIRLQDDKGRSEIILIRIEPTNPSSNMVFRIRPHWRAFYNYLIGLTDASGARLPAHDPAMGGPKLRFDVFVCTAAARPYAMEAWRVLDMHGRMIPPSECPHRLFSDMKRKSVAHVLRMTADKGAPKTGMPLAVIVDDRTDVWDECDQPQVLKVAPFFPHQEQAAGEVGAKDQPTLQSLAEEMQRVQSHLGNLRSHFWFLINKALRLQVQGVGQQPLDLSRPFQHYAAQLAAPPQLMGPPSISSIFKAGLHKSGEPPALPPLPKPPSLSLKPQDPRAARQRPPLAHTSSFGRQQGQPGVQGGQPGPSAPGMAQHAQQQQMAQQAQQQPMAGPPLQVAPPMRPHDPRRQQQGAAQQGAAQQQLDVEGPAGGMGPGRGRGRQAPGAKPGAQMQEQAIMVHPGQQQQQQQPWVAGMPMQPMQGAGPPPAGMPGPRHPDQQQQQQQPGAQPGADNKQLHQGWFSLGGGGAVPPLNKPPPPPGAPPHPQQQLAGQVLVAPGAADMMPHPQHPAGGPMPALQQQQQQFPLQQPGGVLMQPGQQLPVGGLMQPGMHMQQHQAAPMAVDQWGGLAGKRKASEALEVEGMPKVARLSLDEELAIEDPVTCMSMVAQRHEARLQYSFMPQQPQHGPGGPQQLWQVTVLWNGQALAMGAGGPAKAVAKCAAAREAVQILRQRGLLGALPPHVQQQQQQQQVQMQMQMQAVGGVPGQPVHMAPGMQQQQQLGVVPQGGGMAGLASQLPAPPHLHQARPPPPAPPPQPQLPLLPGMVGQQVAAMRPQVPPPPGAPPGGRGAGVGPAAGVGPGRGAVGGRGRGSAGDTYQQQQQQQQHEQRPRINQRNAIKTLYDHFPRASNHVDWDLDLPQEDESVYVVKLVVNQGEYSEDGRAVVTGPDDAARKGGKEARCVQRAKQDAALKVLARVGYSVDFTGTATGGVDNQGRPLLPHAGGNNTGGGGGGGHGRGGGAAGAPTGGRSGGGPDGMKRFKLHGSRHNTKSLDTRHAMAMAAGAQPPPMDAYLKQLNEELS